MLCSKMVVLGLVLSLFYLRKMIVAYTFFEVNRLCVLNIYLYEIYFDIENLAHVDSIIIGMEIIKR